MRGEESRKMKLIETAFVLTNDQLQTLNIIYAMCQLPQNYLYIRTLNLFKHPLILGLKSFLQEVL